MRKKITLILTILLALKTIANPMPVYASNDMEKQLRESINNVAFLLKETLDDCYSKVEEELEEKIVENGYDYSLTMETFYDQPNPIKDADFISYLAAYMSCKQYGKENGISIPQIREIPFIQYSLQEKQIEEYIPTEIPTYYPDQTFEDEYWQTGSRYVIAREEVPEYVQIENGRFKMTGNTITIIPDSKTTIYAEVSLSVIKPENIFDYLGISKETVNADYAYRESKLKSVTTSRSIAQRLSTYFPLLLGQEDLSEYEIYLDGEDELRKQVVYVALSLKDKIPYQWGGKAIMPGYDTSWWTYDKESGLQKGLDCSGFVNWVFLTCGYSNDLNNKLISTGTILSSDLPKITKEELRPGDIGVTNRAAGTINHTGIYIGNDYWVHCSSVKKTVVISKTDFTEYYTPFQDAKIEDETAVFYYLQSLNPHITKDYNKTINIDILNTLYYTENYSAEDVKCLAQYMEYEAGHEETNCWIAVGEVIKNRLEAEQFPDTIYEVINVSGPYIDERTLSEIEPSEEMLNAAKMILKGHLKIINNPDVLYFAKVSEFTNVYEPLQGEYEYYTAIGNHAFYLQ